jgi:23S rRNA (guanine2445-N2)-methyltransferase / 23S rRNA (guanine2069-N7)-methyltransferase
VSAFRIYDADLSEYALSLDLFVGSGDSEGRRMALVEERRRPASVDEQRAARRFADAVSLTAAVLDVSPQDVVAHPWHDSNARGSRQPAPAPKPLVVGENGLSFAIDVAGRPDTGLPLVQRGLRALVGELSAGKRVANLFATSGAATLYAAKTANSTITLDVFDDRLEQVKHSMAANGLAGKRHSFAREDARLWLTQAAKEHRSYDLVVCVPPTRMPAVKEDPDTRDWELQRDHASLLTSAARVLGKDGTIVFATTAAKFKLNSKALQAAGLEATDVSAKTLPRDFERSARDYHCYLVRHANRS